MKRNLRTCLAALLLILPLQRAAAWSNHALPTWQALATMPGVADAAPVAAESLESFLAAEGPGLQRLLAEQEQWARSRIPLYPPRPDALAFRAGGTAAQSRQAFLAALRINPGAKLGLFVQTRPGSDTAGRATLPWTEVTTLRRGNTASRTIFLALREGEPVAPLDVLASATDEPDYGLDLGVWEDNGTPYGKQYGMGKQPFGNPAVEFSSQAPLHMGFYHEAGIVYQAAAFLKRTYPEYRIHLYQSLAAYAMRTGHPYWGWRFGGWALHFVQDLTQPYHATVLPGVGTARLLWINTLDLLGFRTSKEHAITLVSNRHLALENYEYRRLRDAYLRRRDADPLMAAARDPSLDAGYPPYSEQSPRRTISAEAHAAAAQVDRALEQALPAKYVADPSYVLGETELDLDLFAVMAQAPPAAQESLTATVAGLMRRFGAHTRSFVAATLLPAAARPADSK
jgi:hypothetical protein